MPEETYRVYSAMETRLLSNHVRQIGTSIKGLHSSLDDMLSLLVQVKRDLDNYLDHNPCQVCSTLRELGRVFAEVRRDGGDPEGPSVPAPPYQPSPLHSGVPGSVGEGVEGDCVVTPASLPSLIPNSSSSFSSQCADGDKVSVSGSSVLRVFTEFGDCLSQQSRVHQSGGSPGEEDSFPMENSFPLWILPASSLPIDSSICDRFSALHSHESRISSGFLNSPTLVSSSGESSSSESLSYFSPGPFPGGYSASSSSIPFRQASQEEVCSQEEECVAALALALEKGLQGLSEGVRSRGSGGGGHGTTGSYSQGETQFRAL